MKIKLKASRNRLLKKKSELTRLVSEETLIAIVQSDFWKILLNGQQRECTHDERILYMMIFRKSSTLTKGLRAYTRTVYSLGYEIIPTYRRILQK